jgi:hypothetical protein
MVWCSVWMWLLNMTSNMVVTSFCDEWRKLSARKKFYSPRGI